MTLFDAQSLLLKSIGLGTLIGSMVHFVMGQADQKDGSAKFISDMKICQSNTTVNREDYRDILLSLWTSFIKFAVLNDCADMRRIEPGFLYPLPTHGEFDLSCSDMSLSESCPSSRCQEAQYEK